MPLTVQQLNADTTFLLTLSDRGQTIAHSKLDSGEDFTVLIDPWLTGPSPIFHAYFAVSNHSAESTIQSLTELSKPPDLIIVSQPKNDHCNRETLCTLPKSWRGTIAAVPAAAKKIRAWNHFDEKCIQVVPTYNPKNPNKIIRLSTRLRTSVDPAGEITIANIPEPYDLSAVHNAIGITIDYPQFSYPTPPERPLSILYTPHGLSAHLLEPYLTRHLRPYRAYPVDLLFHSLNTESNPKLMGGVVSNGAPGGIPIAKMMAAKTWIGAHDEEKTNGGIATKLIRCAVHGFEEVEEMLRKDGVGDTEVRKLGVGEEVSLDLERERDGWWGKYGGGCEKVDAHGHC